MRPAPEPHEAGSEQALALLELQRHAAGIRARALECHRSGRFPTEDVELLRQLGLFRAFGREGCPALELMQGLRAVGRLNLSLGRLFEGHINAVALVRRYGAEAQRARLKSDALGVLGVWNTEPDPKDPVRIEDGRLCGRKSFATGAGHIAAAVVTAEAGSGGRQMVVVDASDPARADASGWRVSGMRGTCSGLYDLTGLQAGAAERLGAPGDYVREPMFSAGAWRFTAVQLGGAEHVLLLLRAHLKARASCDAVQAARFAHALAAVRGASLWVREAAARAEAPDAGEAAIACVLMTRGVVEDAALEVMEAAARIVGTRAFFEDDPLDLACRDLSLYLRQPVPDQARDRAARAFLEHDCWSDDPLW